MSQMMLSRVAERVYWMARYLERAENTARIVNVYANLLLDLPRGVDLSWYTLIEINDSAEIFNERYKNRDERNVIKFMLADDINGSSMLSSLKMARENARTCRDVIPGDTWEMVNELKLFAEDNMQQGLNRGHRHEYLNSILKGCHQFSGLFANSMNKDAASEFIRLGRTLERADMATRILDAGATVVLSAEDASTNISQIVWGNVLRSLDAYQPYLRKERAPVNGAGVARFLLADENYPRTVMFSMNRLVHAVSRLPHNADARKIAMAIEKKISKYDDYNVLGENFREYMNDMQLELAKLHNCFAETWFLLEPETAD
jgi:uncharacterized alpha-E superfamily protein